MPPLHGGMDPSARGQQSCEPVHVPPGLWQMPKPVQRGTPWLSWRQHLLGSLEQLFSTPTRSDGMQKLFEKLHESVAVLQTWPGLFHDCSPLQRTMLVADGG